MKNIHLHVNGKRRRICDIVASSPWAVNCGPVTTRSVHGISVALAEGILRDRTNVVFSDEAASEINGFKTNADNIWTSTPGVMPPFPSMFIEANTHAEKVAGDFVAVGVHLKTWDVDTFGSLDDVEELRIRVPRKNGENMSFMETLREDLRKDVRAIVRGYVWIQRHDGSVWGPVAAITFPINRSFRVMHCEKEDDWYDPQGADKRAIGKPIVALDILSTIPGYEFDYIRLVADAVFLSGSVAIRTIGMMNASNVKVVEGGRTNDTVSERRRQDLRLGWIRYHVLRLKVGTKLVPIPDYSNVEGPHRENPLQIVRGHFKDYSVNGVFGKYKGEKYSHVWCPSFVRGSVDSGVVVRDYEMRSGAESA